MPLAASMSAVPATRLSREEGFDSNLNLRLNECGSQTMRFVTCLSSLQAASLCLASGPCQASYCFRLDYSLYRVP
jgi:hypothetical protein